MKIGTAALIAPSAAESYYGSSSTSTNGMGATTRPPEIIELARALKNNPDLIYEYVRNNIDIVWMYGLHKGALGASIDKAGTSFDQAMLMVELLRQGKHSVRTAATLFWRLNLCRRSSGGPFAGDDLFQGIRRRRR